MGADLIRPHHRNFDGVPLTCITQDSGIPCGPYHVMLSFFFSYLSYCPFFAVPLSGLPVYPIPVSTLPLFTLLVQPFTVLVVILEARASARFRVLEPVFPGCLASANLAFAVWYITSVVVNIEFIQWLLYFTSAALLFHCITSIGLSQLLNVKWTLSAVHL